MKRNVIPIDAPYGHLLVEYDPQNPDPCFTPESVAYIEARQAGLTPRDIAKLDEIEWFTCHRHTRYMNQFAIPGLRPPGKWEACYVKRFNSEPYLKMLNEFLTYDSTESSANNVGRWIISQYRLICPSEEKFYSVEYSGDWDFWQKRIINNATHFETLIARFDRGRFIVSDGREVEFADMKAACAVKGNVSDDF